jgi:hypothetical protein
MRQDNLNRHVNGHKKDFLIKCDHCNFYSKRKDNLKLHINKYHDSVLDSTDDIDNVQSNGCVETETLPIEKVLQSTAPMAVQPINTFEKRLILPHNFIYAGATQSVSEPKC